MAKDNLISFSLTEEEMQNILDALSVIEYNLKGKVVNLTPEERQLYGKLGNRTKNWVKKVKMYMEQKPELVPFYLNKNNFDKDYAARETIIPILHRLTSISESLDDTAKLTGSELYNASLAYYRNIKIVSQENVPGTTNIYKDLSAQFPGRSSQINNDNNNGENPSLEEDKL